MCRTKIISLFIALNLGMAAHANGNSTSSPAPHQEELSAFDKGYYDGLAIWMLIEIPTNLMLYPVIGAVIAAKSIVSNYNQKGPRSAIGTGVVIGTTFAVFKTIASSLGSFVSRVFVRHTCRHQFVNGENSMVCGAVGNMVKYVISGVSYPLMSGNAISGGTVLLQAVSGVYNGAANEGYPQTRFANEDAAAQISIEMGESALQSVLKSTFSEAVSLKDAGEGMAFGGLAGYFITRSVENFYVPCAAKLRHFLGDPRVTAEELAQSEKVCPFSISFVSAPQQTDL